MISKIDAVGFYSFLQEYSFKNLNNAVTDRKAITEPEIIFKKECGAREYHILSNLFPYPRLHDEKVGELRHSYMNARCRQLSERKKTEYQTDINPFFHSIVTEIRRNFELVMIRKAKNTLIPSIYSIYLSVCQKPKFDKLLCLFCLNLRDFKWSGRATKKLFSAPSSVPADGA